MTTVIAKLLKFGDQFEIEGKTFTVESVEFCDGDNGEEIMYFPPIDEFTKTAAALKVIMQDAAPIYMHPRQPILVLDRVHSVQ